MLAALTDAANRPKPVRERFRPVEEMHESKGRSLHEIERERAWATLQRTALTLVVMFTILYTFLSAYLNVWRDEIYTLRTTDSGLIEATISAVTFEEQPPLYFATAAVWQSVLGRNAYSLRLLSVVATAGLLCVFLRFERMLGFDPAGSLGMLTVLALHPRVIWMATEGRAYALWSFIVLSHLYLLVSRGIIRPPRPMDIGSIGVTALLGLLIQPFTGLVLLGESVALLIMRRWRRFLSLSLTWLAVSALVAPIYWLILSSTQELAAAGAFIATPSSLSLREVVSRIVAIVVPGNESMVFSHRALAAWLMVLLWTIGGLSWIKTRTGSFLLIILVAFEVAWFALIRVSGTDWFEVPRYGTAVIPVFFLLLAGGGYQRSLRLWRRLAVPSLTLIAIVAVIPVTTSSLRQYSPLYKGGDWWRVARYVTASEDESQPILVFRNEVAYSLAYHYDGANEVVPFPRQLDFKSFDVSKFALTSSVETADAFWELARGREYVWVVTDDVRSARGVDFGHHYLDAFLSRNTQTLTDRYFHGGSRVRLVRIVSSHEWR